MQSGSRKAHHGSLEERLFSMDRELERRLLGLQDVCHPGTGPAMPGEARRDHLSDDHLDFIQLSHVSRIHVAALERC